MAAGPCSWGLSTDSPQRLSQTDAWTPSTGPDCQTAQPSFENGSAGAPAPWFTFLCVFSLRMPWSTHVCTSRPPGSPSLQEAGWTVQAPPSWTTVGRRLAKEQGPWDGVLSSLLSSLLDILCVTGAQRRILARNVLLASLMVFSEGQGVGPAGLKFSEQPDLLRIGKMGYSLPCPTPPRLPGLGI